MITEINSATKANLIQQLLEALETNPKMLSFGVEKVSWEKTIKYEAKLDNEKYNLYVVLRIKEEEKQETKKDEAF